MIRQIPYEGPNATEHIAKLAGWSAFLDTTIPLVLAKHGVSVNRQPPVNRTKGTI